MSAKKKVFCVDYECANCGNKWTKEYETGVEVKKDSWYSRVNIYKNEEWKEDIVCPNCGLENHIGIKKRSVL